MRRYICLDIGKKRTGVALVDDSARVATPIAVISHETHTKEFLAELISLVEEWEPGDAVIGLPIDLKGKESIAAIDVRTRAQAIMSSLNQHLASKSLSPLNIYFVDERMSTAQAERGMRDSGVSAEKRKNMRDALAAAVIAQTFIDTL